MDKLTKREEALMQLFWQHGPLFVQQIVAMMPDPKPHFNTISTQVRTLEQKRYVAHKVFGGTYQYYATVSEADFSRLTLRSVIDRYFERSYLGAVSALVEEEKISVEELRELIAKIEKQ
ncbi:MAG: BlaI/MecI/CopY family transcriptional regulator [Alistipes sp.]|nr:BlaI/MecI/CopY family transcriptional regulator [Alistipes sp.]